MRHIEILNDNSFALRAPDYVSAAVLSASTEETVSVPEEASHVFFAGTADFYVGYDDTAAIPSSDVTDGTGHELNPTVRLIRGVTDISLISPSNSVVTLSFYRT